MKSNYKYFIRGLLFLSLFFLITCNDNTMKDLEPNITPRGDESYLRLSSDYIFNQDNLLTYELKISQEKLEEIDNNPAAEEYVDGMLIFEGDTISPVGIRYKGSIGAFVGCVDGPNVFEPSGKKTCTKLSMKIKINWNGRSERFYGLKKLQFHSMNLDQTQMHERLGYWLFRSMNVEAPRSVHARIVINGEFTGLFALTEQIDGAFTDYHFNDKNGNVYKEIWPLYMNGMAVQRSRLIGALKTNEDDNPSVELMREFSEKLSKANDAELKKIISDYMDIKKIISYAVVDRAIKHDDGPFHWYCDGNGCESHNFYWYEEPLNKKINLIPWDMDNAFENINSSQNQVTKIYDEWGKTTNDCQPFQVGFFYQWSAACDKLTRGWASYEEEYSNLKKEFNEGPFSNANVRSLITKWSDQIRESTKEADKKFTDAISVQKWQNSIFDLIDKLDYARTN